MAAGHAGAPPAASLAAQMRAKIGCLRPGDQPRRSAAAPPPAARVGRKIGASTLEVDARLRVVLMMSLSHATITADGPELRAASTLPLQRFALPER